ncbi:MAG: sugar phosphate isomerase/epimerase family protein [Pirellulaceae bacterium]
MSLTRRDFLRRSAAIAGAASGSLGARPLWATRPGEKTPTEKFAICNETFVDWPFDKAFATAAECGYSGIEIAPFTISNFVTDIASERRREIRRQAEQAGLQVVGLHWLLAKTKGFHLTSPDPHIRRNTARYLGALADFCADLGGTLLIFGSPKQRNLPPGVTRDQGLQYATEVIHAALPLLERAGVQLAMEPLSPGTTNFLRTAAEASELIQRVDSARCQLILDCLAMEHEQAPRAEVIQKYAKSLVHFHANDPNRMGPGFGELDFVPIFKALRNVRYGGWISVEVFNYQPGPERLARESMQYMKACLARMALPPLK